MKRSDRTKFRGARANMAVRASGGSAMDAAIAEIGVSFDEVAIWNDRVQIVEKIIGFGTGHPAVRARYGARLAMLAGKPIEAASATVDRWWQDERKAFQVASALGSGVRLPIDILQELRIMIRLCRLNPEWRGHFPQFIKFVLGSEAA